MFGTLLLALGLSASIGVSALMPQYATQDYSNIIHPNSTDEAQSVWVDKYNGYVSYDLINSIYTIDLVYGYGYEEGVPLFDYTDYPIGASNYRGFFISNGETQPTFGLNTQSNYYEYSIANTNNYLRMEYLGSNDDLPIGFKLFTGGSQVTDYSFTGGRYFQLNYYILFDLFDSSYNTYREVITPTSWIANSSYEYVYTSSALNFEFDEFINCRFTLVPITPTTSWDNGYEYGYEDGLEVGFDNGERVGYAEGLNENYGFLDLFASIADTPIIMLRSLFNFEVFGVNLLIVVLSLITGLFLLYLIRKLF